MPGIIGCNFNENNSGIIEHSHKHNTRIIGSCNG